MSVALSLMNLFFKTGDIVVGFVGRDDLLASLTNRLLFLFLFFHISSSCFLPKHVCNAMHFVSLHLTQHFPRKIIQSN